VAIFGRKTARQRLRTATQESLAIPTFGSVIDCTPWVTGGLWPAELSTTTAETRGLADHLRSDLQRITRRANAELTTIKRTNMAQPARQAHEARIIAEARAHAVRRIESTLRQQHMHKADPHRPRTPARLAAIADVDQTRVMPAVTDRHPPPATPAHPVPEPPDASTDDHQHPPTQPVVADQPGASRDTADTAGGRHRAPDDEGPAETTVTGRHVLN
jgi:hypothetical protein